MSFGAPDRLWWLLALPPLIAWSIAATQFARAHRRRLLGDMADTLAAGFSVTRRVLRDILAILALGLVIVAWAEPLYLTRLREIERRGVDVMIVLDTSRSMLAHDMSKGRLERAKLEVRGLLSELEQGGGGDVQFSIGLVTFAGDARRISPLTRDPQSFRLLLDEVDTNTNSKGGTAVGEGLVLALDAFDPESESPRVIVLLTDGEDHMSDPSPLDIALRAKIEGVPIHVVAFGTRSGAKVPNPDAGVNGARWMRNADGEDHISIPDFELLEKLAQRSGGVYLAAYETAFPLNVIWDKRMAVMEGVTQATSSRQEGINRYQWALAVALICLGLRCVIAEGSST